MQPTRNEKEAPFPGRPTSPFFPGPQASSPINAPPLIVPGGASRASTPFLSSGPVGSLGVAAGPQVSASFAPQPSSYGTIPPPTRFNGPSSSLPYPTNGPGAYPQSQASVSHAAQLAAPFHGPPIGQSFLPPTGPFRSQFPAMPMGFPPQGTAQLPTESPFSAPRGPAQPSLPGYLPRGSMPPIPVDSQLHALRSTSQPQLQAFPPHVSPAAMSPYHAQQGLAPPPPPPYVGGSLGLNPRDQLQYPGPPTGGALQGLVEDFQSLTVGSTPGSLDPGIDVKSLPRPLIGDEEPTKILEMYPFNCHPRFLRLTTHAIPNSQSLLARWHLPLGAVVHPLAEPPDGKEVPVINFGPAGIIRCRRCRTYINPYAIFNDAGRKWRCNLCLLLNDVPAEYYCAVDATGRRLDADQRPELSQGSVDFVAPTEYMVRPPMPPLYFFLIDVSVYAARSGVLQIVAKTIKSCLDNLPGFPRTQIGFITYDSAIHFHNLKSTLTQPQMLVVSDLDDVFLPLSDDLLVNLSDSRHVVDSFLDSLSTMFQNTSNQESAFGPALRAAYMLMSQIGGKLLVFQSTLPSLGVGHLRLRGEDLRVYGTDKEHLLRLPEDQFYKTMAADFTKTQIAVDIYAFSDKYSDVASLGTLAKYTGGQVYHYPSFQAAIHHEKLSHEVSRNLTRETAWEAVMRIRCGKGVRFTTYHGHFMLRSTDLLALPAVDCDKAYAMQLSLEETLMTTQAVYFQVALLYTSSSGERRIRVHTAAVPVVTDLGEMYRQADAGAVVTLMSRLAVENSLSHKLEDARQMMQLKLVKSLKEYRNLNAVQHRLGGRMIFPESLRYLPLYILCLCKSAALRGGYADVPLDERCAAGYNIMILPIRKMLKLLYPRLFRIDEDLLKGSKNVNEPLKQLRLTAESLDPKGLYLLDDGFSFIIWLGNMLSSDLVNSILGFDQAGFPDLSRIVLSEHDNSISKNLMMILKNLREEDPSFYPLCQVVRQGEQPREASMLLLKLVEDQIVGTSGYVDWILQIHRQSQS